MIRSKSGKSHEMVMTSSAEGPCGETGAGDGRLKVQAHSRRLILVSPQQGPALKVHVPPHGLMLQPRQLIICKRLQRRTLCSCTPSPAKWGTSPGLRPPSEQVLSGWPVIRPPLRPALLATTVLPARRRGPPRPFAAGGRFPLTCTGRCEEFSLLRGGPSSRAEQSRAEQIADLRRTQSALACDTTGAHCVIANVVGG